MSPRKNDKLISSRDLTHRLGADSRDWVVIQEYANWADMGEARARTCLPHAPGARILPPMIQAHNLSKRFDGFTAVEDLTLDVREGEVLGLLGPNGAGKTTTVRMLAGLIAPTSGEATICGHRVGRENAAVRRSIGMLTEVPGLYEQLSARRNLEIYARLHGVDDVPGRVARYLDLLDLGARADEPASTFSKGMKQKLAIARTLIHEPRLIFLDEPTSGLDPRMTKVVREFIRALHAEGRTILLCTHNLDEAQRLCDRIALLRTRLVALDRTEVLRRRLFGRNTIVRLRGGSEGALAAARSLDFVNEAGIEGEAPPGAGRTGEGEPVIGARLVVEMDDPAVHTPGLVRRLVEAGAEILSVAEEEHSLEEIYLKLLEWDGGVAHAKDAGPVDDVNGSGPEISSAGADRTEDTNREGGRS